MDSDDDGSPRLDGPSRAAVAYTNEELDTTTHSSSQAWLVRLPKFLLDRWSSVPQENVEIGRLRIYAAEEGKPQAVTVIVPNSLANVPGEDAIPSEYDLEILNQATANTFVFAEKKNPVVDESSNVTPTQSTGQASSSTSTSRNNRDRLGRLKKLRIREPTLLAKVVHECSLKPDVDSQQYRHIMRLRQKKANQPKRKTQMLVVSQAVQNQMASGQMGARSSAKYDSFNNVNRDKQRARMVRRPQNEVRDLIFEAFEEHRYWSLRSLRERTQQPETYLKELLADIAHQNIRGPYAGLYSLLSVFQRGEKMEDSESGVSPDVAPSPNTPSTVAASPAPPPPNAARKSTNLTAAEELDEDDDDEEMEAI